eukprot:CAMPEP_0117773164 /NCGR_PEP_ID=MMETSP0947-20121206/25660_1 /TAXON_ID=44440 /ORGANISM="Chattonella subsalsa, Strain CCMP2191" /LENGTH=73 /DNA_ID=CAMNT_0005599189 /DNA_START=21 /DNA_END=238 /DNA_ORIENTATION=+
MTGAKAPFIPKLMLSQVPGAALVSSAPEDSPSFLSSHNLRSQHLTSEPEDNRSRKSYGEGSFSYDPELQPSEG